FSGLLVGFGQVFIPGLEEVENGTEAVSFLHKCVDADDWKNTASLDNQFGFQEQASNVTEAELDALTALADAQSSGGLEDDEPGLTRALSIMMDAGQAVWSVMKRIAAFLKKLGKWFLGIINKARKCGPVD